MIGRLRTGSSPKCLRRARSWNQGFRSSTACMDKTGAKAGQERMRKTESWWWVCLSDRLERLGAGWADSFNEVITFLKQQDTGFSMFFEILGCRSTSEVLCSQHYPLWLRGASLWTQHVGSVGTKSATGQREEEDVVTRLALALLQAVIRSSLDNFFLC